MSQLREVVDPLRRFSSCYGRTDRSENKHVVPTIGSVLAHRDQFKHPENSSQHLKRAASKNNQHMEVFGSRWDKETGSLIYVIVKKGSNYAIGAPLCVETGLFDGFHHLRNISFNSSSKDVKNVKLRDRENQPFSFAACLEFGDLVVVLKTGFIEVVDRKPEQSSKKLHVALEYYVLNPDAEAGVSLAVRTPKGFEVYKSFGDLSLPPCKITEEKLLSLLNTPSMIPEELNCMMETALPKHVSSLSDTFLMYTELLMPNRKCHRLSLNFNSAARDASELLINVAKLTSDDVNNYLPYSPVPSIISCSLLDPLHVCLASRESFVAMTALKALRSAKLQSGVSNFQDCRLVDTSVTGWEMTGNGSLHLELRTTAAISVATFGVGTLVKLYAVTNEPLIGKIVKHFLHEGVKLLTVSLNECCGMTEEIEDDYRDNIEQKSQQEWRYLRTVLTQLGKSIPLMKLDFHHSYDTLMSEEKEMVRIELCDFLIDGLVASSRAMYENLDPPNLKPVQPLEQIYGTNTSTTVTLATYQLLPFNQALKRDATHEERVFYQAFLDKNIMVHLHESPVGSGKTTVLAAAVKGRLLVDKRSRIAMTAMTNSAVIAMLNVFNFPTDYSDPDLRPLVVQSKNWKHANRVSSHAFDWKLVMTKCFVRELQNFNIQQYVSDAACSSKLKSMLTYVRDNSIIALRRLLGEEKYNFISKLNCSTLDKRELLDHFLNVYNPNLIIATMDSLINFASLLPVNHMPDLVALDECTVIQPSDLALFASKMQSMSFELIEYVLVGDHKQLNPFNCIQSLSPLTVTPNVLLLNNGAFTTRFTTVHRCHRNATELVSSVFYGGLLTSGKDPNEQYIQHSLRGVTFKNPRVKAFSFIPNNYASCAVAQSRCNTSEANAIAQYAQKLIDIDHIKPSQISVITPYLAQAELLEKLVPRGITCSTSIKYQGLENDIVLFSACHTGQASSGTEDELSEGFRIKTSNNGAIKYKLIDDDSIILVSLTRSKHFTTIFGNEAFLRTIPRWNDILNMILQ